MKKNIIIKEQGNNEDIDFLHNELNIDKNLANLLVQKNIKTFDEAKKFFRPEIENLHDPFKMADMSKAVSRLNKALLSNEKILVYGDYDVDGTTSVAMTYAFLKERHNYLDFYIPDRYDEGYGISFKSIDYAGENGFNLVIALDCGIKAVEKIEYAKQKGIDYIICDHHTPGSKIPDAVAVLDPKREDCNYPYKELSGCGVGFKFLQAYTLSKGIDFKEVFKYIDLVAVSIASDIVDIKGENRILAHFGLKKLSEDPTLGFKAIKRIAGVDTKEMTISDCVFKIGPRINAAGRIKSGKYAVQLMISENLKEAVEFGNQIDKYNTDRKNVDREITHQAIRMIGNNIELRNRKSTVLYNPKWHKGVVGIVASRLTETYYRPTVILTESNGFATGSARSVSDFNLYAAIESCSHLLENFGGHTFAAGLTLKIENVETFSKTFEKFVIENIKEEQTIPSIYVDEEISFEDITPKFIRILKQFSPFGPGNMSPVFYTKNILDTGKSTPVGKNKEHIKLDMVDENGIIIQGIAFSLSNKYKEIKDGKRFDICYSLEENVFRGKSTIQARVKEIIIQD